MRARPQLRAIAFSDDIFAPAAAVARGVLRPLQARDRPAVRRSGLVPAHGGRAEGHAHARRRPVGGDDGHPVGLGAHPARLLRARDDQRGDHRRRARSSRATASSGTSTSSATTRTRPTPTAARRSTSSARLPKPFYFNYFSLTYFPGVDLTDRALRDGHIGPDDVEDVAQKGYHLWGGSLLAARARPSSSRWDIAYTMAVYRFPHWLVKGDSSTGPSSVSTCTLRPK